MAKTILLLPLVLIALFLALFLIIGGFITSSAQEHECYTPRCLQRTNCARWAQGQPVTVYINENEFNGVERAAIREAFNNWQISNLQNGSGVTFNFVGVTGQPATSDTNYHYVHRGTASGGADSSISWSGAN